MRDHLISTLPIWSAENASPDHHRYFTATRALHYSQLYKLSCKKLFSTWLHKILNCFSLASYQWGSFYTRGGLTTFNIVRVSNKRQTLTRRLDGSKWPTLMFEEGHRFIGEWNGQKWILDWTLRPGSTNQRFLIKKRWMRSPTRFNSCHIKPQSAFDSSAPNINMM
jgi:hypothetical protein